MRRQHSTRWIIELHSARARPTTHMIIRVGWRKSPKASPRQTRRRSICGWEIYAPSSTTFTPASITAGQAIGASILCHNHTSSILLAHPIQYAALYGRVSSCFHALYNWNGARECCWHQAIAKRKRRDWAARRLHFLPCPIRPNLHHRHRKSRDGHPTTHQMPVKSYSWLIAAQPGRTPSYSGVEISLRVVNRLISKSPNRLHLVG